MILGNIVIGKRVPIGTAIKAALAVFAWWWDLNHEPIPAEIVLAIAMVIIAPIQVLVAHFAGITNAPSK